MKKVFCILLPFLEKKMYFTQRNKSTKKLHKDITKYIYTYNGDATHNIHAGSQRTTSHRLL